MPIRTHKTGHEQLQLSKSLTSRGHSSLFQWAILLLSFIFGFQTHASPQSSLTRSTLQTTELADKKPLSIEQTRFYLSGGRGENQFENHSLMEGEASIKLRYESGNQFHFLFHPSLQYLSGFAQTFDEKGSSKASFNLYEMSGNWKFYSTQLSFGGLDQSEWHTRLLMDRQAFPGLRWSQFWYTSGEYKFTTFAEGDVPTSTSTVADTGERESSPTFISAGGQFIAQPNRSFRITLGANYFAYQNLPSSVATESVLRGNTPLAENPNDINQKFAYGFSGIEARGNLIVFLTKDFKLLASAEGVQNSQAPEGNALGYKGTLGAEARVLSRHSIKGSGYYFRTEPDAIVSAYSARSLFHSNRVGYGTELSWNFLREKIRVGVEYAEAQVIYETPNQSLEKNILLKLEAYNVEF